MISLEYKYNVNYDEVIEIEKAINTIELTKGSKVNLRSKKRIRVFYDIIKKKFNFNIVKMRDTSIFVTKETFNEIKGFILPIIDEFKKEFNSDFIKGLESINRETEKCDDLRIKYVGEKTNLVYNPIGNLELSLKDYDLVWCLRNLLSEIKEKKFPILISELGYPIKRTKLAEFIKRNLIFFNIIPEGISDGSVDVKLNKELYHLLIEESEPKIRRYIVNRILEYDKRSFEVIYRDRIPNKDSIYRTFIRNWKRKGLTEFQAKKMHKSFIKRTKFLDLLNNAYFSDLGRIITERINWNIFETDFSIFNIPRNEISEKFSDLNLVRNRIVHVIEEKNGKFNILETLSEDKVSMNDILDFSFGLDHILRQSSPL